MLTSRNIKKTKSPDKSYSILGTELNVVKSAMDLGVTVSNDLKWTDHILSVLAKATCMMGFIKRNCRRDLKRDLVKTLCLSLVRSCLCYASQRWAPQSPTLMVKIKNIQRRAKILASLTRSVYQNSTFFSLKYWLEYRDIVFFFKCKLGFIDLKRNDPFEFCSGRLCHSASVGDRER